jgi:Bacterial aa3 type cytochrome c oxidase subunit IV
MKIDPADCHPEMDYAQHKDTYAFFLKATVTVLLVVTAIMAFLAIFVA